MKQKAKVESPSPSPPKAENLGTVWYPPVRWHWFATSCLLTLASVAVFGAQPNHASVGVSDDAVESAVPKLWDDTAIKGLQLPLADPTGSPKHISSDYYYRIPVRPIYKSYPIYHPDKEPSGYLEQLKRTPPEVVWDERRGIRPPLKTKADWIRAGEQVFEAAVSYNGPRSFFQPEKVRDRAWYSRVGVLVAKDGTMPFARYVIRTNGVLEVSDRSCAMCHTRVMPDHSVIRGAQGNFPFDHAVAEINRSTAAALGETKARNIYLSVVVRALFDTPWIEPDPLARLKAMSFAELIANSEAIPPGVGARQGLSPLQPVQIPDLIGIRGRRYLDRSGLTRQRDIADLMRYAAFNQGADSLNQHRDLIPLGIGRKQSELPEPSDPNVGGRYSDEQLYALGLYLYSLEPPTNPHLPQTAEERKTVERGRNIFMDSEQGCYKCHDPKQGYTNNKLIAAPGFEPAAHHPATDDIMRTALGTPRRVGTDPALTLTTRRGTGFYKVPSLRGVWYRGPFEHNGSCATLEDWFDPRRLREDYVPSGWIGPVGTKSRAVKGHEFGLDLSESDRSALIAFLRTL